MTQENPHHFSGTLFPNTLPSLSAGAICLKSGLLSKNGLSITLSQYLSPEAEHVVLCSLLQWFRTKIQNPL